MGSLKGAAEIITSLLCDIHAAVGDYLGINNNFPYFHVAAGGNSDPAYAKDNNQKKLACKNVSPAQNI